MKPYTKPSQPSNVIYYTSSDGNIVTPSTNAYAFGANIVSNNYINGQGIITFDKPVTIIGTEAFLSRKSLTSVTLPDTVTTIGDYAFEGCINLTSVTIPYGITMIGYDAFAGCDSLTNVYCKAITPPSLDGSYVFGDNVSGRKIYVPMESVNAYKSATYWSAYANDIIGYDFENNTVVGGGSLITFTITSNPKMPSLNTYEDATYQSEEGMTWIDWVNSKYNTNGFTIYTPNNERYVVFHNYNSAVCNDGASSINAEDLIESNGIYYYE